MQQLARGIYYENGFPGVTLGALIFPHGTIMVDAPLRSEDARTWRNALINLGSSTNRVLVNLDSHTDRTLGSRAIDSPIIAHQKTAQVFRNRPSVFKGQNPESGAEWEVSNDVVGTRWAAPDITFSQHLYFHWGGPEVILEHHPGPNPGSIWVIIPEARLIFVGDTILLEQPPFLASGDLPAWIESLDLLLSTYREFTIISGRGGPVSSDTVHIQQRLLKDILKGLERLAKRNVSAEMTEALIDGLLENVVLPAERREQYVQRLRHGLFQYYSRRYRPLEPSDSE